MAIGAQPSKWLDKKSRLGYRGAPIGTVAFFGPDNRQATRVSVAVLLAPERDPVALRQWLAATGDLRRDQAVLGEVVTFLRAHEVRTVVVTKDIVGCPHAVGIDYPAGESCPHCPSWAASGAGAIL